MSAPPDRLPPHSPEAEAGVLGCILLAPSECLDEAQDALTRDGYEFYDLRHRTIWAALAELRARGSAIDVITLQTLLKDAGTLEQVGGLQYLAALPDAVPSAANLGHYLAILCEKYTVRRWLAYCAEAQSRFYEHTGPLETLTSELAAGLFRLCEAGHASTDQTFAEVLADVQAEYLDTFRRGVKRHIGPQTGFNYVDNTIQGFAPGDLAVIASRPGTGKSAMMMQMAEFHAGVCRAPVGIFSLEMTSRALGARALFQRGGADMTKFVNGFASDDDIQKLTAARVALAKLPIIFNQSPDLAIEDLEIRARRLVHRHGLKVLFLDYFQLLYSRNKQRNWNTNDELGYCSKRLKALARTLQVPIIVLAQMNREIEKEAHRRPRASDLRDTGQLEQDADIIMFLWKPILTAGEGELKESWKKKLQDILPRVPCPVDWKTDWKKHLAMVTLGIEKNREGRSGPEVDAALVFIKPWTRFVDAYTPLGGAPAQPELPATPGDMPTNDELGIP